MLTKKGTSNNHLREWLLIFFSINFLLSFVLLFVTQNLSLFLFVLILTLLTLKILPKDQHVIKIIAFSTFFFYVIMFMTYYGWIMASSVPYIGGGSDDLRFEELAKLYEQNNWFNFTKNYGYSTNTRLYVTFLASLYKIASYIGEYHTFIPRVFNGFFEIWIIILSYKLMINHFRIPVKNAYSGLYVLAFNPYFKYINSFVFRDTLALLFFVSFVFLFFKLLSENKNKLLYIFSLLFLLFLSYYIRGQLIIIAIGSSVVIYITKNKSKKGVIIAVLAIISVLIIDYIYGYIGYFDQLSIYTDYQGEKGGFTSKIVQMPLLPFGVIFRYIYAFVVPWPDVFGLFDESGFILIDIIYLLCFIYVAWQFSNLNFILKGALRNKVLLMLFLLTLSMYALTTLTFRHILLVYPFIAISYAKYTSLESKHNNHIIRFSFFSMFILIIFAYGILK